MTKLRAGVVGGRRPVAWGCPEGFGSALGCPEGFGSGRPGLRLGGDRLPSERGSVGLVVGECVGDGSIGVGVGGHVHGPLGVQRGVRVDFG